MATSGIHRHFGNVTFIHQQINTEKGNEYQEDKKGGAAVGGVNEPVWSAINKNVSKCSELIG